MRFLPTLVLLLLLALPAAAQIVFDSGTFQTVVDANTPGCTDPGGGVGVSPASASCTTGGYSAVASATAGFSTFPGGGIVMASGEAEATTTGGPPLATSNATSNNSAIASWKLSAPTHYSLSSTISGGAFLNFTGSGVPFPPPASGILTGVDYGLTVSVNVSANANDVNGGETVVATPQVVTASVTFAEVGSPELIMGTVLAGGLARAGLLIEALDGVAVVAATQTANDSSYLLDGLTTSVSLRLSDPTSAFATEFSPSLSPPTTYNADLAPNASVPAVSRAMLLGLALLLLLIAMRASWERGIVHG